MKINDYQGALNMKPIKVTNNYTEKQAFADISLEIIKFVVKSRVGKGNFTPSLSQNRT